MRASIRRSAPVVVTGGLLVAATLAVGPAAGAAGFTITSLKPSTVTATANEGPASTVITFSGTPKFPVAVTLTPIAGKCTTTTFTCTKGSKSFTKGTTATTIKYSTLTCGGAVTTKFTGMWNVVLKDAAGATTPPKALTFSCLPNNRASFVAGNNAGTTPITSGLSDTAYGVVLSPSAKAADGSINNRADCSYDSATGGDYVYTYLIKSNEKVTTENFAQGEPGILPDGSETLALFLANGTIETNTNDAQTAPATGQIILQPTYSYAFGQITSSNGGGVPVGDLLYTGGTKGVWKGGYACFRSVPGSAYVSDHWDFTVTFTKTAGGPGDSQGFKWSIVNTSGQPTNKF